MDDSTNVYNTFWNSELSGGGSSTGGEGKATAELKSPSTYDEAALGEGA